MTNIQLKHELQLLRYQLCDMVCNINVDLYIITFKGIINTHTSALLTLGKVINLRVLLELRKTNIIPFIIVKDIYDKQVPLLLHKRLSRLCRTIL